MRWSFPIGRIAGIRIDVNFTFLLLLALAVLFSPPEARTLPRALGMLGLLGLLFLCVLLHELGHALMARRYGIVTREITLTGIGGVARLERMPEKPAQEIAIALAGPGVNLILAVATGAWLVLRGESVAQFEANVHLAQIGEWLFTANVVMMLFNLIPAFPMDGGRVLRGILAMFLPFARATRIATTIGQGIAILFAIGALFSSQPQLAIIALFVFIAAGEERSFVQSRSSLSGMQVSAAMMTAFVSLETRHDISHAVELLLASSQQDFPVLEGGQFLGMLSRDDIVKGLREEGGESPVGRLVRLDCDPLESTMPLDAALQRMRAARQSALPVVARGRLVGLLTLENIGELMLVQEARQRHAGTA